MNSKFRLIGIILILLLTTGCGGTDREIVIAEQYGLAYAPIVIMREQGYLEAAAGDSYTIRWEKLGNTAAIREAMLSDGLDIGFMGIPPFLIGYDQGMDWKIISGLTESPLGLMTNEPAASSFRDIAGPGKIVVPQPGSIQHILLSMAAEREFGDAKYLDHQLLSMNHPDGFQALKTGQDVIGHFTSPPYLFQEQDHRSIHQVLDGNEAFGGEFTFIVGVCTEDFKGEQGAYNAFIKALNQALDYMKDNPEATIEILAKSYELPEETVKDYIYQRNMSFGKDIKGVQRFADFMLEAGYLNKPVNEEEVIW